MALQHAYSVTVADGTATSVVRPSDWNSFHNQLLTVTGNTSGQSTASGTNVVYQGGNNITLSIAQGANVATMQINAPNASSLVGGNNITIATAGSTISVVGANEEFFSNANGVTFGTVAGVSVDTVTASVRAGMFYSGANGSGSSSQIIFANSNGVSFSTGTQGMFASVAMTTVPAFSASGGSSSFGTLTFSNSANGITFSNSNGQVVVSHSLQQLSNTSAITASAMNTSISSLFELSSAQTNYLQMTNSSQVYAGTNATVTMASNGLSISAGGGGNVSQTGPNFADGNGVTVTSGTVVFANSNGVSFGLAAGVGGGTMTASAAGGGGGAVTMGNFEPAPLLQSVQSTLGLNSLYFVPMKPAVNVTGTVINMLASLNNASSSISLGGSKTLQYGLYSKGTGASSTALLLIGSSSIGISQSASSSGSVGFTIGQGTNSYTWSSATGSNSVFVGEKILQLPFNLTMTANGEYYFGLLYSSATGGHSSGAGIMSLALQTGINASYGYMGPLTLGATSANNIPNYVGFNYSSTSNALPGTVVLASRVVAASGWRNYIQIDG